MQFISYYLPSILQARHQQSAVNYFLYPVLDLILIERSKANDRRTKITFKELHPLFLMEKKFLSVKKNTG